MRNSILGGNAALASGKAGLTGQTLSQIAAQLPSKNQPQPSQPGGSVKSVQIRQLVCVDETNPEFAGSDEVFIVYNAFQGANAFPARQTGIIPGLDTGKTVPLAGANANVFPPPGAAPGQGDVEIIASVFEDDSADNAAVADLVKKATDFAAEVLKQTQKGKAFADPVQALGDFFSGLIAGLPTTQFLGSDVVVVRPNGQTVSLNGAAKTQLTVQRFNNRGNRLYRYDLREIKAFQ